jgi:hypothetical protein
MQVADRVRLPSHFQRVKFGDGCPDQGARLPRELALDLAQAAARAYELELTVSRAQIL